MDFMNQMWLFGYRGGDSMEVTGYRVCEYDMEFSRSYHVAPGVTNVYEADVDINEDLMQGVHR